MWVPKIKLEVPQVLTLGLYEDTKRTSCKWLNPVYNPICNMVIIHSTKGTFTVSSSVRGRENLWHGLVRTNFSEFSFLFVLHC